MSLLVRKFTPMYLCAILAIFMFLATYFVLPGAIQQASTTVQAMSVAISSYTIGLGAVSFLALKWRDVARRRPEWQVSVLCIILTIFTALLGIFEPGGVGGYWFGKWFYYTCGPPHQLMLGAAGLLLVTACHRAFRARSMEAAVLLIAGVFSFLKLAPMYEYFWGGFYTIGGWIMDVWTVGGMRSLFIGMGIGALAVGVRTVLGLEEGYLGRD